MNSLLVNLGISLAFEIGEWPPRDQLEGARIGMTLAGLARQFAAE